MRQFIKHFEHKIRMGILWGGLGLFVGLWIGGVSLGPLLLVTIGSQVLSETVGLIAKNKS